MTTDRHVEIAGQFGIEKRRLSPTAKRPFWVITCGCGHKLVKGWKNNMPPDQMVKWLNQQGWAIAQHETPTCPTCKQEQTQMNRMKTKPEEDVNLDARTVRRLFAAIEAVFDEATLRYREGHSDATVARDMGLPLTTVIEVRKEAFGELAEDPELTEIRSEAQALLGNIAGIEERFLGMLSEQLDGVRETLQKLIGRTEEAELRLMTQRN